MSLTLTMPWPPSNLSPNARQHHMALYRAKKAYRNACAWQAKLQGAKTIEADRLEVRITFYPPDRRRHDKDNLIARFKAGQDGLADVLGVDDGRWQVEHHLATEIGGMVKIEVRA